MHGAIKQRTGRAPRAAHRVLISRRRPPRTPPHIDEGAGFVNKSEMIDAIARHADISKAAAGRALEATVAAIKTSLKKGDIVTLVGFGSFYVGRRNSRAGRNPRTGDAIKIEAAKVPKFRAGKALKDELN
jgi:DNA-binding protein HU-beta